MRLRRHSEVLYAAETDEQIVALTFDDGPSPSTLPILDTLAEHGVRATFFVVGDSIRGHEEILRRTRDEGHEIGNHSKTHAHLDTLDRAQVRDELTSASAAIESVLGEAPKIFRPPYFDMNDDVLRAAAGCGYRHTVCATVYTNDWDATDGSVVAEAILEQVTPGCIIDLHDGKPPRNPPHAQGGSLDHRAATADAVRIIVPELLSRGYRFATASELLGL